MSNQCCPFCGSDTTNIMNNCDNCGAPVKNSITVVMIDLEGVKGVIKLSIAKMPMIMQQMLPSRLFDMKFEGPSAVLSYRGEKPQNTVDGAIAIGKNAKAVGKGGVMIGGNATGNVIVNGNQNKINQRTISTSKPIPDEEILIGVFLPDFITNLIILGNGNTEYEVDYPNLTVSKSHATIKMK